MVAGISLPWGSDHGPAVAPHVTRGRGRREPGREGLQLSGRGASSFGSNQYQAMAV